MDKIVEYLTDLNIVSVLLRLVLAMVVGGTIGLERGKQGRAAGMRTHILVCLGATLASIIGIFANETLGYSNDPLRIARVQVNRHRKSTDRRPAGLHIGI